MHIKKKADDTNVKKELPFFASFPPPLPNCILPLGCWKGNVLFPGLGSWRISSKKCDTLFEEIFPVCPMRLLSKNFQNSIGAKQMINKILWQVFLLSKWAIKTLPLGMCTWAFLTMANKNLTLRKQGLSLLTLALSVHFDKRCDALVSRMDSRKLHGWKILIKRSCTKRAGIVCVLFQKGEKVVTLFFFYIC